ncbi:MAG: anti-sigma-factor antagonist, partial [Deltaproteobacteria bacterium]|nr:anti-sigma-factor antagonist [Deltaproteobacteria bacterium]
HDLGICRTMLLSTRGRFGMTMDANKFELKVEASLANLSVISTAVSEAMREAGMDAAAISGVILAVDEACTNIALYAYPNRKGYIRLQCWLDHGYFVISIEDKGKPFNPCSVPPPRLDVGLNDRKVGGLGIHLMRKLMDEISYTYDPVIGNQLTMRKHVGTGNPGSE